MKEVVLILCSTFLLVLVIYWMMPIKKMIAVNKALKSLLQVIPISQILSVLNKPKTP